MNSMVEAREWQVVRTGRRLHRFACQILHMNRTVCQKFLMPPNWAKYPYYYKGNWVNISNSFDLEETAVMRNFVVAKFESVLKIEVAPFLAALVPDGSIWTEPVNCYLWWFCEIWASSSWSELVLFDLLLWFCDPSWFLWISDGSF